MLFNQDSAAGHDAFGLIPEEARGFNFVFQRGTPGLRKLLSRTIFFEQLRGDYIDSLVRALGRQDRGNEQFQWVGMIQFTMSIRISLFECVDDFPYPRSFGVQ